MGVFLRWGVFGILAVAALVYAYNALGRLADRHVAAPAAAVVPAARTSEDVPAARASDNPSLTPDERDAIPAHCQVELDIARRAAEAHSIGEPLDRVLRIQEIAWEKDEKLRARYAELATHWFNEPGPVDAARIRREVVKRCVDATL
jgi:hypothetical protein